MAHSLMAVARNDEFVAYLAQMQSNKLGDVVLVLYDEYSALGHSQSPVGTASWAAGLSRLDRRNHGIITGDVAPISHQPEWAMPVIRCSSSISMTVLA